LNRSQSPEHPAARVEVVAAESYRHWRTTVLGRVTEKLEMDVIFELAGPVAGRRVLDVGTGDGAYAIEAADRGAHVVGVDLALPMLAAAGRRARERGVPLGLVQGLAQELPYGDGTVDLVIAVTVLCFVAHPDEAVREMSRVLAPGGRLILGELGRWNVWAAGRRVRSWLGNRAWRSAHFWSKGDVVRIVRRAGLDVLTVRGAVFYPPSGRLAAMLAPIDPILGRLHAPNAAFLAVAARKPRTMTT
jgi:ubiquinone/menaquinone biosynthesis C-methylase UbiE